MTNTTNKTYLTEAKTVRLCEKYSKRMALVEKVQGKKLSLEKKATMANIYQNTQTLLESVQSSDIGQFKRFALDIG